ncbi:PHA/PHB synthase family protein [Piscinibacter sp.]|uniref:PHA/PHB synthase family protein n=1 Tax=Piscinibacter sp. TaxID=1903157 RepID=UPI0039E2F242
MSQPHDDESPTARLDRLLHVAAAPLTGGLSPVSLGLAWADWAWHLGVSPGRQMELAALAAQLGAAALQGNDAPSGAADEDPRFRHPDWETWPFHLMRSGFRGAEAWWRVAARQPGMTPHHAELTDFMARQWLGVMTPANWLPSNPVVLHANAERSGAPLRQGWLNWLQDLATPASARAAAEREARFKVGRDVAVTPGEVVMRNGLAELIRYTPQTRTVHPEPVLIVPSWIMKYYILDLSPHNSLVRWLVSQGHVVYMLSWKNPDAADHDLTMDDYLQRGPLDALRRIAQLEPGQPVHAMGYCLGGTLMAIAAAALAREGVVADRRRLATLKTLTLLAAQVDFSEPGELGLFIDESQIAYLKEQNRARGYFPGDAMAGSFQFLHSRDLVWTRRMREYLMGEREQPSDLMAWNSDTTRMPARMHHEYLVSLYLHNALAMGTYRVGGHDGKTLSLADLHLPVFMVGTSRDHVSPWRSVYKLHHLCDAEITFALASGGHNAGIVSEPGHPRRGYRIATRPARGAWVAPDDWERDAAAHEGSWWPAWQQWLARRSSRRRAPHTLPRGASLASAPGEYVLTCYPD